MKPGSNPAATVARLQDLIESDKASLAREIHDDLGGYLIASAMDVTILRHRFAVHDEDARRKFDRLAKMLNGAIDMMRRMTEELHPTLLDNVGLFTALRWELKHLSTRTGLVVRKELPDTEITLDRGVAIAMFRAAQEALAVAVHHHGVSTLEFVMTTDAGALGMTVSADGKPGPLAPESRSAIALGFLFHRIDALGGSLTLSHPDAGGITLTTQVDPARLPDECV